MNPAFGSWMQSKTVFAEQRATVIDVFVSKSDNLGESDLIALYQSDDGLRFALMIEDKVDAPLQPDQAARYRLRADREVKAGVYSAYAVVLSAPAFYLANCTRCCDFDATVSFEDMAAFVRENEPSRRADYRATFLETAARRRSNNWVREVDTATEAFWEAAYLIATREFPILEMKRLRVTKGATWINFRPADMPTLPKRIYVSVKGDRGQMDLTFSNTRAHFFRDRIISLLDPDMTVHQTSASAAIRIEVAGFGPDEGVVDGMHKVRRAFEACARLIAFYRANRAALNTAARETDRQAY